MLERIQESIVGMFLAADGPDIQPKLSKLVYDPETYELKLSVTFGDRTEVVAVPWSSVAFVCVPDNLYPSLTAP